jgi:sphinganine C4-monooxygenase
MAANSSTLHALPPLPEYTLTPLPPLLSFVSDKILVLIVPVVAYWTFSLFFHFIDENDLFAKYRLHTPAEMLKRNRVSVRDVVREVVIQHIIQTLTGWAAGFLDPDDMYGKEDYDVAVWATRIRLAQRVLPGVLSVLGFNAAGLASKIQPSWPIASAVLSGGQYPWLTRKVLDNQGINALIPTFATWELVLAKAVYYLAVPALQYFVAVLIVDTWQYFLHRAMHMNQYLYKTLHSRHHRLYVPYAFGALYNHPLEGFLLDSCGAALAVKIAGLTCRQTMFFYGFATLKTVDDHCGYALPWDPLQILFKNNAPYHDVHHQGWGIKVCSTLYYVF